MDVTSAITLGNGCQSRVAWSFGTVLPGSSAVSDRDGSACVFTFGSSNDTAALRLYQSDRSGAAFTAMPSTWSTIAGTNNVKSRSISGSGTAITYNVEDDTSGSYARSFDGGATWTTHTDVAGSFGAAVSVPSANVAWRIGDAGARVSSDAAANPGPPTWAGVSDAYASGNWSQANAADAIDASTAWVIADSHYAHLTTNPAASPPWSRTHTLCNSPLNIEAIDATTAFVPGRSEICRTTDGNGTWTELTSGLPAVAYKDVASSPGTPTTVWAVGDLGTVARSTDNGTTWAATAKPRSVQLFAVEAVSATEAYVAGSDGMIYRTTTSGSSWARIRIPTTSPIVALHRGSDSVLVVAALGGGTWTTVDGGATWTGSSEDARTDIDAVHANVIVHSLGNGRVSATANGGSTWTTHVVTGMSPRNVRGVAVIDDDSWLAVGDQGFAARTDDGGATWTATSTGTSEDLWDVDVGSDGTAVAVGESGAIVTSASEGRSWTSTAAGGSHLVRVSIDGDTVVAAGHGGTIRRSTDSGVTWTSPVTGATSDLVSLDVSPAGDFFASGGGQRLQSSDGGATWSVAVSSWDLVAAVTDDIQWMAQSVPVGGWSSWARYTTSAGSSWTVPFASSSRNSRSIHVIDGGRIVFGGYSNYVRITDLGGTIPDFAAGVTDWSAGAGMFGGCLQALGGTAAAAGWTADPGGRCEAQNTDPWNPLPTAPVTVATSTSGGTGTATFVWGVRVPATTPPGTFTAGIVAEAIAPAA